MTDLNIRNAHRIHSNIIICRSIENSNSGDRNNLITIPSHQHLFYYI